MSIATRIHQRRQEIGISQEDLGLLVGKDQKQIWRYETGRSNPTGDVLVKLAQALDTTADWILGLTDNPERPLRGFDDLSEIEKEAVEILRKKTPEIRLKAIDVLKVL